MSAQRNPMAMASILDSCNGAPQQEFAPGTILISEGETSGRLYVLAEGTVEVLRGDTPVAVIAGASSIFDEMSVLLNRPHTATVRAATPVGAFVFDRRELSQVASGDRVLSGALARRAAQRRHHLSRRPQASVRGSRQSSRHGRRSSRDADPPAARRIYACPGREG
jgi:CRP-like cAMP-binding protein